MCHLLFSVAKRVVERSPLTYNNCTLEVSLKQPLKTDELPKENTQKCSAHSDQRTIVVYDVPKTLHSDEVMLYFENKRSSRGGKITDFDFDRKNGIKITYDSPTGEIKKIFLNLLVDNLIFFYEKIYEIIFKKIDFILTIFFVL